MADEEFEQFCRDVFATLTRAMKELACIYVDPDSQTAPKMAFEKTFAECFKKSSTIIWLNNLLVWAGKTIALNTNPYYMAGKKALENTFFAVTGQKQL